MSEPITAAIVACALLSGDTNLHHYPPAERARLAAIEAEAFVGNVRPHVPLLTLLAVGYVESRFDPHGSQADRDGGMFGVMQIEAYASRCVAPPVRIASRRGHRYRRHDDPARCTAAQAADRARLLDPATNIALGARILELRWRQVHTASRPSRAREAWTGAYYVGSVPRRRRALRRFYGYARRVARAQMVMDARVTHCPARAQRSVVQHALRAHDGPLIPVQRARIRDLRTQGARVHRRDQTTLTQRLRRGMEPATRSATLECTLTVARLVGTL